MPWLPEEMEDAFWFAVSPLTTVPMALYTATAYATDDWRFGKPDFKENLRNALLWAGIAGSVYGWNALVHPGKYPFMTAGGAVKTAAHIAAPAAVPAALATLAVGSAVGWAATAEHHGAVTPGVASGIGMPMTPELYSTGTSDNPAGWDFGTWWSNIV